MHNHPTDGVALSSPLLAQVASEIVVISPTCLKPSDTKLSHIVRPLFAPSPSSSLFLNARFFPDRDSLCCIAKSPCTPSLELALARVRCLEDRGVDAPSSWWSCLR